MKKEKAKKINKPPFKCPNFNEPGKKSEKYASTDAASHTFQRLQS